MAETRVTKRVSWARFSRPSVVASIRSVLAALGIAVALIAAAVMGPWRDHAAPWLTALVVLTVGARALWNPVRHREVPRSPAGGNELLSDLRERLDQQAQIPDLGEDFHVETCVLPASGAAFSGDFSAAARRGQRLELALTDVSGHGPSAGMRALLLSGAVSGLLGEVSTTNFLPAANRYLIRQGWRDGFASCIHLAVDLDSGRFDVGSAGHPSAAHFHASTKTWEMVSGAAGLLLGLFELGPEDYSRAEGVLEPGDVVLLYTDGVVEGESGDLLEGTHRMLEYAAAAISDGLEGAAQRICQASAERGGDDDRSAVVVWRAAA